MKITSFVHQRAQNAFKKMYLASVNLLGRAAWILVLYGKCQFYKLTLHVSTHDKLTFIRLGFGLLKGHVKFMERIFSLLLSHLHNLSPHIFVQYFLQKLSTVTIVMWNMVRKQSDIKTGSIHSPCWSFPSQFFSCGFIKKWNVHLLKELYAHLHLRPKQINCFTRLHWGKTFNLLIIGKRT